jgi:predicted RNA-binding Zn-ribbon protein involved in translation (DUF1610 family)
MSEGPWYHPTQEVAAMLKFRCQHCGQRIAVPARHLGKLVTCAECGASTHPLAEQIVQTKREAAPPAPAVPTTAPTPSPNPCANCGKTIGRLQTSLQWEGQQVCGTCHHVLSAESSLGGERPTPVAATRVRAAAPDSAALPGATGVVALREQMVRGLVVFVVGVVALYGALTLLRDLAGLIAVSAVAVLALLALYAVFRSRWTRARQSTTTDAALVAVRQ